MTMPEPEARAYLNAKYAQITKAVADGNMEAATGVIAQMRADGHHEAADHALDGLIEISNIRKAADSTT